MDKVKIFALSKSDFHNIFTLEKKQEFFSGFRKFLVDMEFDENEFKIYSFGRPFDEDGEPDLKKEKDINELVDVYDFFSDGDVFINIVYGLNKIFLTIITKKDQQEKIMNCLNKFCSFYKHP